MHPDRQQEPISSDENRAAPTSFGHRHGYTVMIAVFAALFVLVIFVNASC